jgi:uridine kinase
MPETVSTTRSEAHLVSKATVRIIGITGGSGSGKTTFARAILAALGEHSCAVLQQDRYYIDQSARFTGDGESVNFDHPDALDFKLLRDDLVRLRLGEAIAAPIYDFATHKRLPKSDKFESKPFILLDGTLILSQEIIRPCLDMSFFFECEEKIRFERRLRRDVRERGRTPEGVRKQFDRQVKPMHDLFVEPSKIFATHLLSGETPLAPIIAQWAEHIRLR